MANNWTWAETRMAFALYLILDESEYTERSKEVQALAQALGRTPSAVKMKLWNISSCDANKAASGKKGMSNASKLDKLIWEEHGQRGDELVSESVALLNDAVGSQVVDGTLFSYDFSELPAGETKEVLVRQRVNQSYFRNTLLTNYQRSCCVTGIKIDRLLVASHIKPWKVSDPKTERLAASNGLLLNAFHDKAFDKGLMTIDCDYRIRISSKVKRSEANDEWLWRYDGEKIALPLVHLPARRFIEYHNDVIFVA